MTVQTDASTALPHHKARQLTRFIALALAIVALLIMLRQPAVAGPVPVVATLAPEVVFLPAIAQLSVNDSGKVEPRTTATRTPTIQLTATATKSATPTRTSTNQATASSTTAVSLPNCSVPNLAWTEVGVLLRGGAPADNAFACLAGAGVDVVIDQRLPGEDPTEPTLAQQAGLEYINLGITNDTAPSPTVLRQWIDTVNAKLAQGKVVLVHDAAGRGRMGIWDAVYFMLHGASAERAIEDRYLAKALPFSGAKIGCSDGGNGGVQALAEIGLILTGIRYVPAVDEHGTQWQNCARPAYMAGWDYASVLP
jgi:hypothetical protein